MTRYYIRAESPASRKPPELKTCILTQNSTLNISWYWYWRREAGLCLKPSAWREARPVFTYWLWWFTVCGTILHPEPCLFIKNSPSFYPRKNNSFIGLSRFLCRYFRLSCFSSFLIEACTIFHFGFLTVAETYLWKFDF